MAEHNDQLTQEQIATTAELLSRFEQGYLPEPVFFELSRLMVVPVVELVPLRMSDKGDVEVLLIDRGDDDPYWPGTVHVPGTVFMASDRPGSLQDVFGRLLHGELHGVNIAHPPKHVKTLFHETRRGKQLANVFWVELLETPAAGNFYNVAALPENVMDHHLHFIGDAAEAFYAQKTQTTSATISP